jgi:hypothetical protein
MQVENNLVAQGAFASDAKPVKIFQKKTHHH